MKIRFPRRQRGAMFGLDARIALAIMGALSVIAGTALVGNIGIFKGQGLSQEIKAITAAVEGLQEDIGGGIYENLASSNATNAFMALIDSSVLNTGKPQDKWLGPYIKLDSNEHPQYGTMTLIRASQDDYTDTSCGRQCFLWLTLATVPDTVFSQLNKDIDGSEGSPETTGRVRHAASNGMLYVRLTKTL